MVTEPLRGMCCDSDIGDPREEIVREIVGRVAGKWHLWTLHVLYRGESPIRFARLLERVPGISQKMLTQTVRDLERDGLVTRTVYAEVPPRVEYSLTEDGREIMERFAPFWNWIACKAPNVERSRAHYDARPKAS
ncbi:MAG: transcriptional regulator [Alphaproteobacteria bacterium]|nr:MAG: transcriptional regulator [Alphaproteobacteria bacterium]